MTVDIAPPTARQTVPSVVWEPPSEESGGIGKIIIDRPDDAVNALSAELTEDLAQAVRAARGHTGLKGLIITSAKQNQWIAGADLKLVTQAADQQQVESVSRRFQAVCDELAWLPCTTVAAINGAALGGGFELALACDYRVAAEVPSVVVGQPEVNLGLIPAGGGTQRLPRLVGLQRALDLILSGRRLNARRARRAGLLDEVVHPNVLDRAARAWAGKPKRALSRPIKLGLSLEAATAVAEQTPVGRSLMYRQARLAVLARTGGHYPAPLKALEAIEIGFEQGMAAGLEAESRAFGELAVSSTAKNLIWLFLATQRQKRKVPPSSVERMGMVGAGFMGAAIAEVAAAAGVPVRVRDVAAEGVARGLSGIRKIVDAGVARRRLDAREGRQILQRVSGTTDYSGFSSADLVIEAVFEQLDVKRAVIRELEAVVPADAVIASNTSAIPIGALAAEAKHPERIVGMHFFSPAERMPLLEVIRPTAAADWAVERAVALGNTMGKTVIVVSDSTGFYTSRVLGVMLAEAAILLGEGARVDEVDRAMTAFGFPVGPFVLYDEVGLEVALHVGETVAQTFGGEAPGQSVVGQLVAAGHTGKKSGTGFYIWHTPSSRIPKPLRGLVIKTPSRVPNPVVYGSTPRKSMDEQAIQERLALLFVNEAIRCLEEGVLTSPTDGDLGAVLGLGFPPFLGGPFHYADSIGLSALVEKLQSLTARSGPRYAPASLLVERAREGRTFFEE